MAELPGPTHPAPLRTLRAAHRGASRMSRRARTEVQAAAREVARYAQADGVELAEPDTREAIAWVLLAIGAAPDRDQALTICVELIATVLDEPEGVGDATG